MTNHLWQSTLFTAIMAVFALALRRQPAKVRHAVWLAASLKFAVPFSLLVTAGSRIDMPAAAPLMPAVTVEQITASFSPIPAQRLSETTAWTTVAYAIWLTGTLLITARWTGRWLQMRRSLRSASRLPLDAPLPVFSTSTRIEPGVFGVFRPVLLLPNGIVPTLAPEQLDAILTHELAHVRRRDNLTAAMHMGVAAVFWFHPFVWWIGRKLIEERERACDEAVLAAGRAPQVYAQSILNVCKFYAASPLECAAGVSGADLRQRIEEIMTRRMPSQLTWGRASILAGVSVAVLTVPLAIGILRAQTLPAPPKYRFEVASIRRGTPGAQGGGMSPGPQGGFRAVNVTALQLITHAYDLHDAHLAGGPKWAGTERFTISATPDTAEGLHPGLRPEQFEEHHRRQRQRVQALLLERFGLVLRAEKKEMSVYGLSLARSGLKMRAAAGQTGAPTIRMQPDRMSGASVSPTLLANALSRRLGREVLDETGLTGFYDFDLNWTPDATPGQPIPAEATGPSIFTAVEEQLGLKLVPKKGRVPVLVIERLERPSEN